MKGALSLRGEARMLVMMVKVVGMLYDLVAGE